jgi:hypothetical protein
VYVPPPLDLMAYQKGKLKIENSKRKARN